MPTAGDIVYNYGEEQINDDVNNKEAAKWVGWVKE